MSTSREVTRTSRIPNCIDRNNDRIDVITVGKPGSALVPKVGLARRYFRSMVICQILVFVVLQRRLMSTVEATSASVTKSSHAAFDEEQIVPEAHPSKHKESAQEKQNHPNSKNTKTKLNDPWLVSSVEEEDGSIEDGMMTDATSENNLYLQDISIEEMLLETSIPTDSQVEKDTLAFQESKSGGIIIVSTVDGTLAGLSRTTGHLLWQRLPNASSSSSTSHHRMPYPHHQQQQQSLTESPPLLEPLVSTTTTTKISSAGKHLNKWKTAAVPSILNGKVHLTAAATVIAAEDGTDQGDDITVTASVRQLVERAPFVDVRGRIYTGHRQSVAVAVDSTTGQIVRAVPPELQWQQQQQQQQQQQSDRNLLWMGRVDYYVSIHEPRTGELDVQFSSSELLSVHDMLLGSGSGSDAGPWESSYSQNDMNHLLAPPNIPKDDPSSTRKQDSSFDEGWGLTQEHNNLESDGVVTTPGGYVAYRHAGRIVWVSETSFDTPVAFAFHSTSSRSLNVEIVPDAILPHGSSDYVYSEMQRQLDLRQSTFVDGDVESIVGSLPGSGQLFAIPLGGAGSGSRTNTLQHQSTAHAKAFSQQQHKDNAWHPHQAQITAGIPHEQQMFRHESSVGSTNRHTHYGINHQHNSRDTFASLKNRHDGPNFLTNNAGSSFEVAGDGGIVPFYHPDYGYYIAPEQMFAIHQGLNANHKKYQKILKILGSWLPALIAFIFVSSFEMGRRKRQKDNENAAAASAGIEATAATLNSNKDGCIIQVMEDVVLGHGGHGTVVYKGMLDGRQIAVKRMLKTYHASADREISLLIESDGHPNVVRYFLKEVRGDFVYLALELCDLSLHDLIGSLRAHGDRVTREKGATTFLDFSFATKSVLYQIVQGVGHLHRLRIVHRDLKPANILLADSKKAKRKAEPNVSVYDIFVCGDYIAKISDMGLGKQLVGQSSYGGGSLFNESSLRGQSNGQSSIIGIGPGSVGWQAPEVMAMRIPSDASAKSDGSSGPSEPASSEMSPLDVSPNVYTSRSVDIFSLGCIFYSTLVPGSHPFGEWYEREANIMHYRPNLDALEDFSKEAYDLVLSMIQRNPRLRPTAKQISEHPFFWPLDRRLSFLCDFSDRLETDSVQASVDDSSSFLAKLLAVERNACNVVGSSWDRELHDDLINNVQRFRTYDPSSIRDLLRLIRNKHHHFDELSVSLKEIIGSKTDGLMMYIDQKFPKLVIHCFRVCREIFSMQDSLSVKYSIVPSGNSGKPSKFLDDFGLAKKDKANITMSSKNEENANSFRNVANLLPKSQKVPELDEDTMYLPPTDILQLELTVKDGAAEPPAESRSMVDFNFDASQDLILWQGSAATKTYGCRGWNRSDCEWERRHEMNKSRRDNGLLRCIDDPKFRTRLCNHWDGSLGTFCPMRKKGKCIFAHGPVELRVKEAKRNRWGKLVDSNGDNNNPNHSGGEDTYGAACAIESERKQDTKSKSSKALTPREKKSPATRKSPASKSSMLSVVTMCIFSLSWLMPVDALSSPCIHVCQDKNCLQQWRHHISLPDTLADLLQDTVIVETTNCLSQCGKGPNICIKQTRSDDYLNGIANPTVAKALLTEALQVDINSKLLAAVNVLEKAHGADTTADQDRFVSSIIKTLGADKTLRNSTANCRAYVFRAELNNRVGCLNASAADAKQVIEMLQGSVIKINTKLLVQAYRSLAETYEHLENWTAAMESLQEAAALSPALRTKLSIDMERIKARADSSSQSQ